MDIHGLQKLTLLDFPGRVACTVFLQGCDLRCPFCHNGGLVLGGMEPVTDDAGLLDFLKKRRGLLDGVAVTGGEPLLRRELPALLRSIKELGYAVKLDTNGSHPEALRAVVATGLVDYVAMDIKNSPAKYAATVGLPGFDLTPVRQSAALLLEGTVDYAAPGAADILLRVSIADDASGEVLGDGSVVIPAKQGAFTYVPDSSSPNIRKTMSDGHTCTLSFQ